MARDAAVRVLVVEDEVLQLRLLRRVLTSLGHEIAGEAATLAAGLDRAREGGFHVALLDLNLRGQPSTPIADELRRGECHSW